MCAEALKPRSLRFHQSHDAWSLDGRRGRIWVWTVAPTAYASHVEGHLDEAMARLVIDAADPLYRSGRVAGFHDWFGMTGYDSSSRVLLTQWVLSRRAESRLYIGLRSKLVAMGVSVANLALGNLIQTFQTLERLEAALEDALRGVGPPLSG